MSCDGNAWPYGIRLSCHRWPSAIVACSSTPLCTGSAHPMSMPHCWPHSWRPVSMILQRFAGPWEISLISTGIAMRSLSFRSLAGGRRKTGTTLSNSPGRYSNENPFEHSLRLLLNYSNGRSGRSIVSASFSSLERCCHSSRVNSWVFDASLLKMFSIWHAIAWS